MRWSNCDCNNYNDSHCYFSAFIESNNSVDEKIQCNYCELRYWNKRWLKSKHRINSFFFKFLSLSFVDNDIDSKLIKKRSKVTYEHEFFSIQISVIWISKNNYEINKKKVRAFRKTNKFLKISNAYAYFELNNKIIVTNDFLIWIYIVI